MIHYRKHVILFVLLVFLTDPSVSAEEIRVGLEPLPPLITDEKRGYTIDLLKEIEKNSGFTFRIIIMNYIRAKKMLKENKLDMIGHVPCGLETEEFYGYAQELKWNVKTPADLYVMDKNKLNDIKNLKIGIPSGNEDFAAEILGVSKEHFYPGKLENLPKMLQIGRIDAFWFERASTMTTLEKLKISQVYYKQIPAHAVLSGFAVRKDEKGTERKEKLDALMQKANPERIFKAYLKYADMPEQGVFELPKK
ncbi:MAG: transporter substrate-binding domain-containing protein [Desulfococcaceae bacterium]|jgi:polar amino acid transport system substrate-binding protein|nr:transporter substrate-binding domain-containing protein [Desulfococcaceae bacterium]